MDPQDATAFDCPDPPEMNHQHIQTALEALEIRIDDLQRNLERPRISKELHASLKDDQDRAIKAWNALRTEFDITTEPGSLHLRLTALGLSLPSFRNANRA